MNARGESIRELSELFRINRAGIPRPLLDRNGGVGGGAAAAAAAATAARMRMPTADGGWPTAEGGGARWRFHCRRSLSSDAVVGRRRRRIGMSIRSLLRC